MDCVSFVVHKPQATDPINKTLFGRITITVKSQPMIYLGFFVRFPPLLLCPTCMTVAHDARHRLYWLEHRRKVLTFDR